MNKVQDLKRLYKEVTKELCDIIGDETIELYNENTDDPYYNYLDSNGDACSIKSVFVNKYSNIDMEDPRFLHFDIYNFILDEDGYQDSYITDATFQEIPLEYGLSLLEKLYSTLKGDKNDNK